jgi:N-acetyl-gamma-glutamyl-phosphate reductase
MIEVGIYGASGYMGGEALRVLSEHPQVKIVWATSRRDKPLEFFHRNFYGDKINLVRPEDITPCDAVFFAVPTGTAMEMIQTFLDQETKVIDLGADFRLKNLSDWEHLYRRKHIRPEIVQESVYGIPELHRQAIKKTKVVANPGCYASACILGIAPLIKAGLVETNRVIVDGLSGTAGAGAELDTPIHHPEIGNNIVPYNVVNHRHTYEMEQELSLLSSEKVIVHFTSAYVPITRGILAICHCFPKGSIARDELLSIYREFYRDQFFIRIFDMPPEQNASWQYLPYPWVSAVSGTNFCHIGLEIDEKRNRIVVFSVLDSVGKGGAHAGVQNLNLLFGLDEKTGLTRYGLHPY